MSVSVVGATWGWNDSGALTIPKPGGTQAGDVAMNICGNQATDLVGAGFTEGAGMGAWSRAFLHSWPHPGNGGTLDFRYKVLDGSEPDPFVWSCAAILDLGVCVVYRSSGPAITLDTFSTSDNTGSTSSTTHSVVGAANRFCVAVWYTQSGGVTTNFTGDASLITEQNAIDPGTLRQVNIVQNGNAPVGAFTKTATMTQAVDNCAYMTTWVGTISAVSVSSLLPILGVGS